LPKPNLLRGPAQLPSSFQERAHSSSRRHSARPSAPISRRRSGSADCHPNRRRISGPYFPSHIPQIFPSIVKIIVQGESRISKVRGSGEAGIEFGQKHYVLLHSQCLEVPIARSGWNYRIFESRSKNDFNSLLARLLRRVPRSNSFSVLGKSYKGRRFPLIYFQSLKDGTLHALVENRRSGAQRGASENNFGQRFSVSTPCLDSPKLRQPSPPSYLPGRTGGNPLFLQHLTPRELTAQSRI